MKVDVMLFGVELIAESENDKEVLNFFHISGVRVTGYDVTNHRMMIEKSLERSKFFDVVSEK